MAKAVLIMDMPGSCFSCNLCHINSSGGEDRCQAFEVSRPVNSETYEKPDWCPLRELPEKKDRNSPEKVECGNFGTGYIAGFNDCLDKILNNRKE